ALRKPLTQSRPARLSPRGSPEKTVGATSGAFIGSSRGAGDRPYWAVPADTEPEEGGAGAPAPAQPHGRSTRAARPGRASAAAWLGFLMSRTGKRGLLPAASPRAMVMVVPSLISWMRTPAIGVLGGRTWKTPRT